jgi:hypothetical protein
MRWGLRGQSSDKQVGWRIFEWIRLPVGRAICGLRGRWLWLLGQCRAVSQLELDDSERGSVAPDARWRGLVLTGTPWRVWMIASSVLENRRLSDCLAAVKALATNVCRGLGRSSAFIIAPIVFPETLLKSRQRSTFLQRSGFADLPCTSPPGKRHSSVKAQGPGILIPATPEPSKTQRCHSNGECRVDGSPFYSGTFWGLYGEPGRGRRGGGPSLQ